jgi:hypothetical protein
MMMLLDAAQDAGMGASSEEVEIYYLSFGGRYLSTTRKIALKVREGVSHKSVPGSTPRTRGEQKGCISGSSAVGVGGGTAIGSSARRREQGQSASNPRMRGASASGARIVKQSTQ